MRTATKKCIIVHWQQNTRNRKRLRKKWIASEKYSTPIKQQIILGEKKEGLPITLHSRQ